VICEQRVRERRKKKKKDLKSTPKLQWQHHRYYRKDLDEMNQQHQGRSSTINGMWPYSCPKASESPTTFRWLVLPTSVTLNYRPWWCWIYLIEIFFIVLVVSFLEFRCAFEVSLFISFFFYIRYLLSLL
jgi:hypothetical protein